MDQCGKNGIPFSPKLGPLQAEFLQFCHELIATLDGVPCTASLINLRARACGYQDRPTLEELRFMLVSNIILDLALHGWTIDITAGAISLCPADEAEETPIARKERTRQKHLIERDAQLSEPSVQEFIKGMERRRLTGQGWHSIYSVMRDGEELAASLKRAASYKDTEERACELRSIVDPYLQIVTPESVCSETGLRLGDIWRYFRHTWVNTYRSVPGRHLMILVRDRARPYHPVVGIAALASSVVQQSIRDKWIGWDTDTAVAMLCESKSSKLIRCLLIQLEGFLNDIYVADLVNDGILSRRDLTHPTEGLIKRLRKEAEKNIRLHRKNPDSASHKAAGGSTDKGLVELAKTHLYRSKRCKHLASLLGARMVLDAKELGSLSGRKLQAALQQPSVKQALGRLVRFAKAQRVGISMMDITVCGAVAPYNVLLGGKLVCLLLCSPEIAQAYTTKYRDYVSIIASGMKGKKVCRKPALVLLCTTSLYGHGSSQYNRIKIPADVAGGKPGEVLQYQELGTSEGFGSFQFSKETIRIADAMLGRSQRGRKVNSIFGEGVNPLMRKMREALAHVGLPTDLLKHGNKRIVYGVRLARNFQFYLLGFDKRAHYIMPQTSAHKRTSMLAQFWSRRWLAKRIEVPSILQRVAENSLAYPVRHGAQVRLPDQDMPGVLRIMAAASG